MYEQYLGYHHIPCGAVIDRIRAKEHLTQRELAERSGIYYQRINDFIAGRRRISPEQSLQLEKAFGIDTESIGAEDEHVVRLCRDGGDFRL